MTRWERRFNRSISTIRTASRRTGRSATRRRRARRLGISRDLICARESPRTTSPVSWAPLEDSRSPNADGAAARPRSLAPCLLHWANVHEVPLRHVVVGAFENCFTAGDCLFPSNKPSGKLVEWLGYKERSGQKSLDLPRP